MPRARKNIPEDLQFEIAGLYHHDKTSLEDVLAYLEYNHAISMSRRTLIRRLKEWELLKRTTTVITEPLVNRVRVLFFEVGLQDDDMLLVLQKEFEGQLKITKDILIRLRWRLGLKRSIQGKSALEAADKAAVEIVRKELAANSIIDGYGKTYAQMHMRQQQINIARDRLFRAYKLVNPVAVDRRTRDMQRHRGEFRVPGPNWCWSIDGHDKLKPFGIGIYGCIDAYSRYIILMYVGISNSTQVSVLRQYLDATKITNNVPRFIRSDRGVETPMLAGSHYELQLERQADLLFKDCYIYGTSTHNVRIESWWQILSKSCLYRMRVSRLLVFDSY